MGQRTTDSCGAQLSAAGGDGAEVERIHELVMELVRVAGFLRAGDQEMPGETLSLSQGFALHELDVPEPLSQRELADRLGLEKSTVSRLVADLERRELLVRERDPGNRRYYRLRLTELGRDRHRRLGGQFHQDYLRWTARMSPGERESLAVGLAAFARAIRADSDPDTEPDAGQ